MMKNRPNILVVGSLVMDLIVTTSNFPSAGETVIGKTFSTAPGGKGANQAVQAARLGADVTMVGMVGSDEFGHNLKQSLLESGVDISHILTTDRAPTAIGNVQIQHNEDGTENRIAVIPGANYVLSTGDVSFLENRISEFDMVILQLEIDPEVNCYVARLAREAKIPVFLNPAPAADVPPELLSCLTYICPNEHEAESITGILPAGKRGVLHAAEALRAFGVDNVLITLGKEGSFFFDGTGTYCPSVDCGSVTDPTAAGDSFIGAFCTAVAAGCSHETAMIFANCTAGITVSRPGAQPSLPRLDEVLSLMEFKGYDIEPYCGLKNNLKVLDDFISISTQEFSRYISTMDRDQLQKAAGAIIRAKQRGNRLHITGIGKPSHVSTYAASLFSSVGTPTYYLHGTEAVHGSCGQLVAGDVVICISNSGETAELKATAAAIRSNGCTIIAITGNPASWLGSYADICLVAGVGHEGDSLNRAPRASILAEIYLLQCLSILLQDDFDLTPQKYVKFHPGGSLGRLRENETCK